MLPFRSLLSLLSLGTLVAACGCSLQGNAASSLSPGLALTGTVHGGQQPVTGARVYLFAANTTGYGNASVSLLSAASTGLSDWIGAYVLTTNRGNFSIAGDYSCIPGTQVYLYAVGGNPGAGVNSAAGFLAALGNCPASDNFSVIPFIVVNEVSTVAAAYAFAGFAADATHVSSSGTTLAQIGIANAFANATNLADLAHGTALLTTPAGNGIAPQRVINTLANILAACVNSSGPASTQCSTLFSKTLSSGTIGTMPTDTATAAINLAHHPGTSVSALYGLGSSTPPFAPALTTQPNDFIMPVRFTGGGLDDVNVANGVSECVAIDGSGNAWIGNLNTGVTKLSPLGAALSPANTGFLGGGLSAAFGIAVDPTNNVWVTNYVSNSVSEFSNAGLPISPSAGYTGGGLSYPEAIALDGAGHAWIADLLGTVSELSSSGAALSPSTGYAGYTGGLSRTMGIAIDGFGSVWAGYFTTEIGIEKFSNSGKLASPANGFTVGTYAALPTAIAIDASNAVWVVSSNLGVISKLSNSGVLISPTAGFSGGGVPGASVAIDGSGNAWFLGSGLIEYSNSGAPLSPSTGFQGVSGFDAAGPINGQGGPTGIAIDGSGNIWISNENYGYATEFIGAATPVVTPLSVGVKNNSLGTRP